jgi:hypothetical protein
MRNDTEIEAAIDSPPPLDALIMAVLVATYENLCPT